MHGHRCDAPMRAEGIWLIGDAQARPCHCPAPPQRPLPLDKRVYTTACGQGVSLQEFLDWKNCQEKNTEIILV